jgi:hypothetical protein
MGTTVRVKAGQRDPDFPELDLSGWIGTVLEVDTEGDRPVYLVAWTDETHRRIDPAVEKRCEEQGLDYRTIWLEEDGIELDSDNPATAPSVASSTLPPALSNAENRICAALGVPPDAGVPDVEPAALEKYHEFLRSKLSLPLPALYYAGEVNDLTDAKAVTLFEIVNTGDSVHGLIGKVRYGDTEEPVPLWHLSVASPPEAREALQDYSFWLWRRRTLSEGWMQLGVPVFPVWNTLKSSAVYGFVFGAPTGALLATMQAAPVGALGGMALVAVLGYIAGARYGAVFAAINGMRFGQLYGAIFGTLAGALIGTVLGVFLIGAAGTVLGSIAGSLLGGGFASLGWKPISRFAWTVVGACGGGVVLAAFDPDNRQTAMTGALVGAGAGALLLLFVVMMLLVTVGLASRR